MMASSQPLPNREESMGHVSAVARLALERAAGGRKVPEEMSRAVAEGRGDRGRLAAVSRDLFGTAAKPLELVLFDTDRIASYVFESSRPPVLAGGSKILRDLNEEMEDRHPGEILYSGGGEGMLLVEADRAAAVRERIAQRFAEKTGGALGVTVASIPASPDDFVAAPGAEESTSSGTRMVTGTQAVLAQLRDRVQTEKQGRLPPRPPVPGGAERCVSCRDRAAGSTPSPRLDIDRKPEGFLCDPCSLRWTEGKDLIEGNSFDDLVDRFKAKALGDRAAGARSQYLGFLYADGNAMGTLFGRLPSLVDIRFASRAVSEVFAGAHRRVEQAVTERVPIERRAERPLLSLLGGGDEAIWILPGALAVMLTEQLAKWIDEEAAGIPGLAPFLVGHGVPRLTFGAGLVLCDRGFPVRYQHELAGSLLKSAKAMGHGVPPIQVMSSIDFAVLTESSPWSEDLKTTRALTYQTAEDEFMRTCRPYTWPDFEHLLALARRANETKLGKSQLHALQAGAIDGRKIFLNQLRYQVARRPVGGRYRDWMEAADLADSAAVERFFLRRLSGGGRGEHWGTWVPDLLELKAFLDLLEVGVDA
jgi:type IV secretory pathway TrbD component